MNNVQKEQFCIKYRLVGFEMAKFDFSILAFPIAHDYFICMSRTQEQSSKPEATDPFIIIHNYRKRKDSSGSADKPKRRLHDYSLDRKSIILTRTMKAKLEQNSVKPDISGQLQKQSQQKSVSSGQQNSNFFNENQLQKGIPLSDSQDEDILYNRNEMSWASNYSKLQKTLFGMSFPLAQKQEEEQQSYKKEV